MHREWGGDGGRITSHVFLSLVDNKCISAMLLLLLIWLFVLVSVDNYPDLRELVSLKHTSQGNLLSQ